MPSQMQSWLESASLGSFYKNFADNGITDANFVNMQFMDYDRCGITTHDNRQKLYKLIQSIKKREPSENSIPSNKVIASSSVPAPAVAKKEKTPSVPAPAAATKSADVRMTSSSASPGTAPSDEAELTPLQIEEMKVLKSKIRVIVRKRPLNKKEKSRGEMDIATVQAEKDTIVVHEPKTKVDLTKYVESHPFHFDGVFGTASTNAQIYEKTCRPLVSFFLDKGKVTCFAYGQTGSGKTFTMMGPEGGKADQSGLYVQTAKDIFERLQGGKLKLFVSFFEIYGGKLYDLLNERKKLVSRQDASGSVNIVGIKEQQCTKVDELLGMIAYGNSVRSTGQTGANVDSSRSHAILQLVSKKQVKKAGLYGREPTVKWKEQGKFSFIDLAGSERAADTTNNDRRTRLEGAEINKSLLALKECIRALDQDAKHRPFRGSKLTQVLKDSFLGNSRTIMIANVSPGSTSVEHTLNTLRYADRVKELKKSGKGGAGKATYNAYMPHSKNRSKAAVSSTSRDGVKRKAAKVAAPEWLSESEEDETADKESTSVAPPAKAATRPAVSSGKRTANITATVSATSVAEASTPLPSPPIKAFPEVEESFAEDSDLDASLLADKEQLMRTHHELCSEILREEEMLVEAHRSQIDGTMCLVKEEMELLKRFDAPTFCVDEYADQLEDLLARKMESITALRTRVKNFKSKLTEEEMLCTSFDKFTRMSPEQ